jgi:hypothetical protein
MNIQQKIWLPIVIASSAVVLFGTLYKTLKPHDILTGSLNSEKVDISDYILTASLNREKVDKILSENPNLIETYYGIIPIIVDKDTWEEDKDQREKKLINNRLKYDERTAREREIVTNSDKWKEKRNKKEIAARAQISQLAEEEGWSNNTGKGSKRKKHKKYKKHRKTKKYKK